MAGARKDNKGRVLLKGESYREKDKRYQFKYTDKIHLFQRYYYPEKTRRGINEE